ncbi:MAG TPA: universal stress protein [Steroidobacteraceae bacterium]|jgi:nucleotide-binding universal stress UspA family protein
MRHPGSPGSIVVGIDGSRSATQAAAWAVDEAASRDIPLRLVYVIDAVGLASAGAEGAHFAAARSALEGTQRTVEVIGKPVKIETEVLWGTPLTKLSEQSRSAAMICVGSMGIKHACYGEGSVARALPGLARCPVAVIHRPTVRAPSPDTETIVVDAENDLVLQHAFEEAKLRRAPLRAIALWHAEIPADLADGNRLARAQLDRRITHLRRMYPDVVVESAAIHDDLCTYLAELGQSVQLLVTGVKGQRDHLGTPQRVKCTVLTVHGNHL